MSIEEVIADTLDAFYDAVNDLEAARAYIADLEEFVRSVLWCDNYITNEGATASYTNHDIFAEEHNFRADRATAALKNLPLHLHDEVEAENAIIYNGFEQEPKDLNDQWALLIKRGLIRQKLSKG